MAYRLRVTPAAVRTALSRADLRGRASAVHWGDGKVYVDLQFGYDGDAAITATTERWPNAHVLLVGNDFILSEVQR